MHKLKSYLSMTFMAFIISLLLPLNHAMGSNTLSYIRNLLYGTQSGLYHGCNSKEDAKSCNDNCRSLHRGRSEFKIDQKQNSLLQKYTENNSSSIIKHEKCLIFDAQNWVCDAGNMIKFHMESGNFYRSLTVGSSVFYGCYK
jgi:hypothetical protein